MSSKRRRRNAQLLETAFWLLLVLAIAFFMQAVAITFR